MTYDYSPEAREYAKANGHATCFDNLRAGAMVLCDAAQTYDAVVAYLKEHTPQPEEISYRAILDGVEPRWKVGARARLEYADGSILEGFIDNAGRVLYGNGWGAMGTGSKNPKIYLLAEAPDQDKDVREALVSVVNQVTGGYGLTEHHAQKVIDLLREKNWSL